MYTYTLTYVYTYIYIYIYTITYASALSPSDFDAECQQQALLEAVPAPVDLVLEVLVQAQPCHPPYRLDDTLVLLTAERWCQQHHPPEDAHENRFAGEYAEANSIFKAL